MSESQRSLRRRFRWLWWTGGVFLFILASLTVTGFVVARRTEPFLRARIVQALSSAFHARVELDSFHVSLGNGFRGEWGIWAQGRGLRIWPPDRSAGVEVVNVPSVEPLIALASFRFHVPLRYKRFESDQTINVGDIRLEGLHIHLPPKSHFLHVGPTPGSAPSQAGSVALPIKVRLGIIECSDATLLLDTSKPGKRPVEIDILHLTLTGVLPGQPMHFEAQLINPKPVGAIHTQGLFGPWQVSDPGESPVSGSYRFDHADLGDFSGLSGILSSTGDYSGTLRNINVDGQTDTPDFSLTHFGNKMDLQTRFHAIVDGTNGDTHLDPVNAILGHSHILARGQVVRAFAPDSDNLHSIGHDIDLDVEIKDGRIEDFLHLTSNSSTPLLTGDVAVRTSLRISPGKDAVQDRLVLKGRFELNQAQFSSDKVQQRIAELSLRGQGRPHDAKSPDREDVQSAMQSNFQMANGVITLPDLVFTVPGADIDLAGTYKLDGGLLGFVGKAKMQATVSKMVGGWKGVLLKPADRFFKKDGAGTEVPIHIAGTYKNPEFGVDVKGIEVKSHTHPQRPDEQSTPAPPTPPAASPAGH